MPRRKKVVFKDVGNIKQRQSVVVNLAQAPPKRRRRQAKPRQVKRVESQQPSVVMQPSIIPYYPSVQQPVPLQVQQPIPIKQMMSQAPTAIQGFNNTPPQLASFSSLAAETQPLIPSPLIDTPSVSAPEQETASIPTQEIEAQQQDIKSVQEHVPPLKQAYIDRAMSIIRGDESIATKEVELQQDDVEFVSSGVKKITRPPLPPRRTRAPPVQSPVQETAEEPQMVAPAIFRMFSAEQPEPNQTYFNGNDYNFTRLQSHLDANLFQPMTGKEILAYGEQNGIVFTQGYVARPDKSSLVRAIRSALTRYSKQRPQGTSL